MDQEEMNKLQNDKSIDPEQLDVEVVKQAETFFYWSEKAVEARAEKDRQEMKVDLLRSRLDGEARAKPEDFGLMKTTEAAISAAIACHEEMQAEQDKLIGAKEKVNLMDKIVITMEQKKRMLELLVTLHGQNYFAGPSTPRNIGAEWKKHQKKIEENVKEKQVKKVRTRKTKKNGENK